MLHSRSVGMKRGLPYEGQRLTPVLGIAWGATDSAAKRSRRCSHRIGIEALKWFDGTHDSKIR